MGKWFYAASLSWAAVSRPCHSPTGARDTHSGDKEIKFFFSHSCIWFYMKGLVNRLTERQTPKNTTQKIGQGGKMQIQWMLSLDFYPTAYRCQISSTHHLLTFVCCRSVPEPIPKHYSAWYNHLQLLFFTIFICISMPPIREAKLVCDTNIYMLLHGNRAEKNHG